MKKLLSILLLLFTILVAKESIPISRTSHPPRIDGVIDDLAWQEREPLPELVTYNPVEGNEPMEDTDVYITYDDDNFYLAFICYDSDISQLRATVAPRGELEGDDLVTFTFDTYNTNRGGYTFNVNPYGNVNDFVSSISGYNDPNWDIVLFSEAKIYDDRWVVELAIPFRSLPFDDTKQEQNWGFYYFRIDKKNNEFSIYPPRTHKISNIYAQSGVLQGLKGIKSGKNLEFLPFLFASHIENEDSQNKLDAGLNTSLDLSSNSTISATINPDYSQIEADPFNIDVNQRNPQWLDEKRPFFSRGTDFYRSGLMNLVYTRNIVNPIYGVKFSGKYPDLSLGVLSALDKGIDNDKNDLFNLFRVKQNILSESSIGFVATNKDDLDNHAYNRIFGMDLVLSLQHNYKFKYDAAYMLAEETVETDSTSQTIENKELAHHFHFERDGEFTESEIWISAYPQNFYPETGFLNYDVRGKIEVGMNNRFKLKQVADTWNKVMWYFGSKERLDWNGDVQEAYGWTGLDFDWKNNMFHKIGLQFNHDNVNGKDFRTADLEFRFWKMLSGKFDFWINSFVGARPYFGDHELDLQNSFEGWRYFLESGFNAKIFDRIGINPHIEREDFYYKYGGSRKFYSYKIWNKITWMLANRLHLRNITQGKYIKMNFADAALGTRIEKEFSTGLLLSYEYSPLSNLYLGFNLNNINEYDELLDDVQLFFKIDYLWRI